MGLDPALGRAYNFFSHTASNTRFLSSDSASIFFNSLFSRSNSLSRRASFRSSSSTGGSSPPRGYAPGTALGCFSPRDLLPAECESSLPSYLVSNSPTLRPASKSWVKKAAAFLPPEDKRKVVEVLIEKIGIGDGDKELCKNQ